MEVQRDSPYSSDCEEEPNRPTQSSIFNTARNGASSQQRPGRVIKQQTSPPGNNNQIVPNSTRSNISKESSPAGMLTSSVNGSFVKMNGGINTKRSNSGISARERVDTSRVQQMNNSFISSKAEKWQSKEESDAIIRELAERTRQIGFEEGLTAKTQSEEYLRSRVGFAEKLRQKFDNDIEASELQTYFSAYRLHSKDLFEMDEMHNSESLRLKKYKKSVFYGEVQNNTRTGRGVMVYSSGRVYEGLWQNDSKFGKGYELYPNGNVYKGFFVNGRPEGEGTYIWYNGEVYHGEWTNGMKHGYGQWMGAKGDTYIGEWKFGKADGKGAHKWINGDLYMGEFKCCLKHGKGQERFSNGDVYVGQYQNGRPEGQGEYFWGDGAYYIGLFKNGLRHGTGVWRKRKDAKVTDVYEGEYVNDKRCGYGVFNWGSGNVYKGNYFEDLRHGQGEMYWVDTSFYKGEWEKGIQCGYGELYTPNEGVRKGQFVNNVFRENGFEDMPSTGGGGAAGSTGGGSLRARSRSGAGGQGKNGSPKRKFTSNSPVIEENSAANRGYGSSAKKKGRTMNGSPPKGVKDFAENIKNYNNNSNGRSSSVPGKGLGLRKNATTSTVGQSSKIGIGNRGAGVGGKPGRSNSSFLPSIGSGGGGYGNGNGNGNHRNGNSIGGAAAGSGGKRKKREILLKQHEIIMWKGMRVKLGIKHRDLRDYRDEKQVEIIRNYLHPPIWKPTGITHILESPQTSPERAQSPARSQSPSMSVNNSTYKRGTPSRQGFSPS